MKDRMLEEDSIELVESIFEFNQQHIESDELALGEARTLLADDERRGRLAVEIADAIDWFPLAAESDDWRAALATDYDSASLVAFDVEGLTLLRADAASSGSYLSLVAYGDATVDAELWTADAVQLGEDSPLGVGAIDLEAPMASAGGSVPARLAVEVLQDGQPFVSIEEVTPVSSEDVEKLFESWSRLNPGAALELVSQFDASEEQRALSARPGSVQNFQFRPGGIYARVEFLVDYDNPIDAEDDEYLANNVTEFSLLVKVSEPDLDGLRLGEVIAIADPLGR